MGEVLLRSGSAERLYWGISPLIARFPGGLLHTNIASCAIFAAISGSSIATAATVGTVAFPAQEKRHYDISMIAGSVAAGGTLGILIPPSIVVIIYASLVGESVGRLFMGGVIPGLMAALFFMSYIGIKSLLNPSIAPLEVTTSSWKDVIMGLFHIGPTVVLILLVLGTIYSGVATPTEAAALGASGSVVIGLVSKKLRWQSFKESALGAARTTSTLLFIMVGATLLNFVLANLAVPRQLLTFVISLQLSPMFVVAILCIIYLILGCFIDGVSVMILTLPIVYPLVTTLGFDSVWFGIVMVMLIELGMITPPFGINIFVIQGIARHVSYGSIVRGVLGFAIFLIIALILVIIFPELVLWLPSMMMGT